MFFTFKTKCPYCEQAIINTVPVKENEMSFYGENQGNEDIYYEAILSCDTTVCYCSKCEKEYVAVLALSPEVVVRKIEPHQNS